MFKFYCNLCGMEFGSDEEMKKYLVGYHRVNARLVDYFGAIKRKIRDTCRGCEYCKEDAIYDTIIYVCAHPVWGDDERILDPDLKVPDWCPLRRV